MTITHMKKILFFTVCCALLAQQSAVAIDVVETVDTDSKTPRSRSVDHFLENLSTLHQALLPKDFLYESAAKKTVSYEYPKKFAMVIDEKNQGKMTKSNRIGGFLKQYCDLYQNYIDQFITKVKANFIAQLLTESTTVYADRGYTMSRHIDIETRLNRTMAGVVEEQQELYLNSRYDDIGVLPQDFDVADRDLLKCLVVLVKRKDTPENIKKEVEERTNQILAFKAVFKSLVTTDNQIDMTPFGKDTDVFEKIIENLKADFIGFMIDAPAYQETVTDSQAALKGAEIAFKNTDVFATEGRRDMLKIVSYFTIQDEAETEETPVADEAASVETDIKS